MIYHLAKYRGQPFTTGGYHTKTEIMRLESGKWESGPDYPGLYKRKVYFSIFYLFLKYLGYMDMQQHLLNQLHM